MMDMIPWSDDFKTGDREIDHEHWGLFALIHDLAGKQAGGADDASIASTIEALVAYVDVHFEHEERLMQRLGYPDFAAHKKAHQALDKRVAEFQTEFQNAPHSFDYPAFMAFLSTWLGQHILKQDMAFAAFRGKQP